MNNKPTCFVSYCREGMDADSVYYLVQQLRDASGGQIEFLFDEYLKPGSDLPEFMDAVKSANGIIILLTPQYKRKVEERAGGVYTEYSAIMERYQNEVNTANRKVVKNKSSQRVISSPFCLVPVIFSATFSNSCPKEISGKICMDFSDYRAHRRKNGNLYVTGEVNRKYRTKIEEIAAAISAHYVESTEEFRISFDEILEKFFKTTKDEQNQGNPRLSKVLLNSFVKTHSFKRVQSQTSYLLIGRKGSGKSTITDRLAKANEKKYKKHIDINVNDFDLEFIYTFINDTRNKDEQSATINQISTFEVSWQIFLYACCIDAVIAEYQARKLSKEQSKDIRPLINFLSEIVGENITEAELKHKALYRWCYVKIFEAKDQVIEEARSDLADFSYDITVKLEPEPLIERVVGHDVIQAFERILRSCKRRFLVSMDGFDTAFDEFRLGGKYVGTRGNESLARVQFELDWLRGFLHVMEYMKSSQNKFPLASLVDFCTMIPKDRFLEIKGNERDAYLYISKHHDIRWSGMELAIMLRKRLELLGDYETPKEKRPHERLADVLEHYFPFIPKETSITVSGRDYDLPIYIAVLRHTFWRPREILIYFAKIISVVRDFRKRKMEITDFTVSKCISDTTREIISTEFINEFQRHCTNLPDILAIFRGAKQILTIDDLKKTLSDCKFEFIDKREDVYSFDEQVEFLYEIGFLGFRASASLINRLKLLHSDIFWFTIDGGAFKTIMLEEYAGCKAIIHPVFCEYLDLDTSSQDLTLNFDWGYLEQQEAHMMI